MAILNKRIIKSLYKEEKQTAIRYNKLGLKYNIPGLIKAGKDEKRHSKLFKNLKP